MKRRPDIKDVDKVIFTEVYPLLNEIEQRLGRSITLGVWTNLARKMCCQGLPLEDLQKILKQEYEHQAAFNKRKLN